MSDPAVFGDDEPEDAWDPGDATDVLVADLIRRAALLPGRHEHIPTHDTVDALRALSEQVATARRRRLAGRDLLRADQLDADITFLWNNRL